MKPIIVGAASFVLALGLSTGGAVMRHKPAAAKPVAAARGTADSTHVSSKPDSVKTPVDSAAPPKSADSTAVDSTRHDSTTAPLVPSIPAAAAPVIPSPVATVTPHRPLDEPDYKLIAKIFANMKAADAAKVLAYMTDDEVQGVFQKLNVRQAAELMGKLPKERAANLSRRLVASAAKP